MKMNLWIIYRSGFVISKVIAEMLQDRLENYIDVSVGNASKIEPSFIIEEELHYLILGDIISENIPSMEIQNWALNYREISECNNLKIEALSGFLISVNEKNMDSLWYYKFIQNNILAKTIFPPILHFNLDNTNFASESCVHRLVKEYSIKIIEKSNVI
jgi:hypothetical protein